MSESITTAADLAALPLGSIVVDPYAATCVRSRVSDPEMPSDWVRVTVAVKGGEHHHRPFLPADVIRRGWTGYTDADPPPVNLSREDVAREIALGDDPTCPWPDGFTRMEEARAYRQADAVLVLLPGRTESEVKAEALDEFATERYIAYLEDPSLPWADQPSKLSQWYAKTAEELRTRAARLRGESNG